MNEAQLQAKCVLKFSQTYPERRGDLFATFQETVNAAQGSNMLSRGLIPGVPDLIYLDLARHFIGIEMKAENIRHNLIHILEQCRFLQHNTYNGHFCSSEQMFWDIIESDGEQGGLSYDTVRSWCIVLMQKKLGLFSWNDTDDLIFIANKWEKRSGKKMPSVKF